ncbi:MAG: hypothetical protein CMQ49_14670 [Gammaproteobacteria bacterium]|nr:hypothetical protein [Gammaproteobacteria bacterium]|tara:strand:+ start:456 stop:725 length:270 start_codon:yes stop_codon:yes gene_type:complete
MSSETSNPATTGKKTGVRHRFSGALYESDSPNRVRVTLPDGTFGVFDGIGRWIEGDVYDADPQMCVWLSISRAKVSHRLSPQTTGLSGE